MLKSKPIPSKEYLQKHFTYDPETGEFIKVLTGKIGTERNGYLGINVHNMGKSGNSRYFVHRLIWKYMTGYDPNQIDHINGNGLDNRWENLRNVDHATNQRNIKIPVTNKSGYIGIALKKLPKPGEKRNLGSLRTSQRNRWVATIRGASIGTFKCPTAAHFARVKYLQKNHPNHFHPNHGRK